MHDVGAAPAWATWLSIAVSVTLLVGFVWAAFKVAFALGKFAQRVQHVEDDFFEFKREATNRHNSTRDHAMRAEARSGVDSDE